MPCYTLCIITGTSSTFALCELFFLSLAMSKCVRVFYFIINYGNKGLAFGAAAAVAAFYSSPFSIQNYRTC